MRKVFSTIVTMLMPALLALSCGQRLVGQSSLISIPTTDVVLLNKAYVEFDFVSHLESHRSGGFQSYTAKSVFGIARNVEAGVNLTFTDSLEPNQVVEIQPNVKWQFYRNEKTGIAVASGAALYLPLLHRTGRSGLGFIYTVVSKSFNTKHAPRLTAGAYQLLGRTDGPATRTGAIIGYEQPVSAKLTFIADWITGANRFGYVSPGLTYVASRSSVIGAAYNIGNHGRKNNSLYLTYGWLF